jgi:spore maturation protein CgeB
LLTFRVLYFESFDFASSSLNKINELNIQIDNFENFITTSLNVLNQIQLKHRDAIAKFSSDKVNLEKETNKWQTNLKVYLRHLMRQQI